MLSMRALYLDLDISMRSAKKSYARRVILVWAFVVKRL